MTRVIAHRGVSGKFPENTLAAFEAAYALHPLAIEFDVHRCKSGEIVVIHDDTVQSTTNGKGKVAEFSLSALKALDAGQGQRIPTLEEVIELNRNRLPLCVEIKPLGIASAVLEALERAVDAKRIDWKNLIILSFDRETLEICKKRQPQLMLGLGWKKDPGAVEAAKDFSLLCINYKAITPRLMQEAKAARLPVWAWTVNDKKNASALSELEVEALMTDFPEEIGEALRK